MDKKQENNFAPPDGGYGWIIILANTLINICLMPLVQCFGIIFEKDFKEMGVTSAQTSFLLHLHSAIYCSLGLLSSPLLKKYTYKRVALLGSVLMILGIFLSSFGRSYIYLIFSVAVLIGIGQGILLPATYVATNSYFKKRLTLAMCLSITGASLSSIFMPQLLNYLLTNFGRKYTILVLSLISLVAIVACLLLRPVKQHDKSKNDTNRNGSVILENGEDPPKKEEVEVKLLPQPIDIVYQETTVERTRESVFKKISNLFNLELLTERSFLIITLGMAISFASELNIVLMIQFILPELANFVPADVALALSIQAIADIIGRLVVPLISHSLKVPAEIMYCTSLVTFTVARSLLTIFYYSRVTVLFCSVLIGLAKGIKAVFQSVIIPKYVTLDKLPAANGLNMILNGSLSLIIGPIIGVIHDKSRSYVYALHAASILSMACVLMWMLEYMFFTRKKELKNAATEKS